MKKTAILLCMLFIGINAGFAQLVKQQYIDDFLNAKDKTNTSRASILLKEDLLPISSPYEFKGETRKYYPFGQLDGTNVARDTLFYNQKAVLIYRSPLLDFSGITDSLILKGESKRVAPGVCYTVTGTTCNRELLTNWYIINDSLFIGSITQQGFEVDPIFQESLPPAERVTYPSPEVIMKRFEQVFGEKYDKRGLIFAEWVTGNIVGGVNGLYLYNDLTYKSKKKTYTGHYVYPEEYWFDVRSGIVKRVEKRILE